MLLIPVIKYRLRKIYSVLVIISSYRLGWFSYIKTTAVIVGVVNITHVQFDMTGKILCIFLIFLLFIHFNGF